MTILLFIALFTISYGATRLERINSCELTYNDCLNYDANSYVVLFYTKFIGRNLCMDLFQGCKKFRY